MRLFNSSKFTLAACAVAALLAGPGGALAGAHGGVEIGAKGVKSTVVDVTATAESLKVKVLDAATMNTTLSAGLSADGSFDGEALKATVAAVAGFVKEMRAKHKVPEGHVHVVASSGLFSPVAKDRKARARAEKQLGDAVKAATGLTLDFITPRREAELTIIGCVPRKAAGDAVLIDIGSGNTKGGAREGKGFVTFEVPYGSVTFSELAKKRAGPGALGAASEKAAAEVLRPALRASLKGKEGLTKATQVYLSGGACWALATFARPGDRGGYETVTGDDIAAYVKALRSAPGRYPEAPLAAVKDEAARKAAEKELGRVKKAFTPEQLLAGAEVLQALSQEVGLGSGKTVRFVRHGYIAWVAAYAAEKELGR